VDNQHQLTWGGTYIDERTDNRYREFRTPSGSTDLALLAPHNPADWSNNTTVSDDSSYENLGLYLQDNWQLSERLSLLLGVRYSYYEWSFGDVDGNTDDFTGSIRALWSLSENHRLFAGVSRGFRAPNLTNLDGLADRGSSGNPATGNPDLDPEISITYEAGWRWRDGQNAFSLTVFQTLIDDLIQPDFSVTPAVTTNVEDAKLYGFESTWDYGFEIAAGQRLALVGSVSLLDATRDIPEAGGSTFRDNISRANRLYGNVGVEYERGRNWSGLVQVRWHDAYDDVSRHPSDADADDVRLTVAGNPDGSLPGYGVTDVVLGWRSTDGRRGMRLFVENLADKTYREPGSGVDGVGRNFGVTADIRF
jgi:hemoglobin/transferrin/lactoferrin receptor protein